MSKDIIKIQHHRVGDDILLAMRHKKYKASIAYARGIFLFAVRFNLLGPIRQSFDIFMSMWRKLPIMRMFIQCHAIDRYTRKERIRRLFKDRVHNAFLYFIEKLIDNDQTGLFIGIYDTFCQMMDEMNQKQKIRVITAFPMNHSQFMRLQKTMEKVMQLKVMIINDVNSEILGGFVCYTDSIRIDMSLKKDLDRLKYQILSVS